MTDAGAGIGGRYRLDRRLASGGMGSVWQGWDERLRRTVAVKQVHLQPWLPQADRGVAVQRMMREARIAARLHHPNVVQIFDVVDDGNGPCLIMEYVSSRSLQEILNERGPLSPVEAARLGTQVAAGLAAAHRAGIVHRDVKPGNVLITDEGTAKITDFGISHAYDDITLTSTGMVTGTPAYLAPEVARGAPSNYASDVYSLGSTLYMAVEGRPPFGTDENPMAVLHRVASGQWYPPLHAGPLAPLLAAMMSPNPHARPTMVDVANALPGLHPLAPDPSGGAPTDVLTRRSAVPFGWAGATRSLPAQHLPGPPAPRPQSTRAPDPPPEAARRRRHWLPLAAALIVVALGALLGFVLLNGNDNGNPSATGSTHSPPPSRPHTASGARHTASGAGHSGTRARHSGSAGAQGGSDTATGTPSATGGGAPTAQQLADAIVNYFHVVPGDLDTGWSLLTPHFQQTKAQGRESYDNYWNTVQSVDVDSVAGEPPNAAVATLTYHYKDGRVVTQQTQFELVRRAGTLEINSES